MLVATVLGNMEWRRVTGPEFDSARRSPEESVWPFGERGVEWGSVGWPPSGWMVSDRGLLDDAGLGARLLSEGWESLEVEDSGVLIRDDWTVAGPGGVVLIGDPYGSGFPIGWVLSDDGVFELVGPLPFHPDHLEGSRGRPMVLPVGDGFVGIGRREVGLVEFSTPGPGPPVTPAAHTRRVPSGSCPEQVRVVDLVDLHLLGVDKIQCHKTGSAGASTE